MASACVAAAVFRGQCKRVDSENPKPRIRQSPKHPASPVSPVKESFNLD